jgi:integration host factor subunit beta
MQRKNVRTLTRVDIAKKVAELRNEEIKKDYEDPSQIPEGELYEPEQTIEWVETVFTAMRELMRTADPEIRIEIRTFGVFEVKLTKQKPQARNPKTGEIVTVPPRRKTHFKPSIYIKEFLKIPLDQIGKPKEQPENTENKPQTDEPQTV